MRTGHWKTGLIAVLVIAAFSAVWMTFGTGTPDEEPSQQSYVIGLVTNNPNGLSNVAGFREGLAELGFVEGENTTFLFSGEPTPRPQLESAISKMVADGADLIFTAGTPTGVAAHAATKTSGTPVVFGVIADPIRAGVMTDLTRPGGNMTGVMLSKNQARRLEVMHELFPDARRILLPYNPEDPAPVSAAQQLDAIAPELGLTLVHGHARDNDEVTALLADIPEDIDAVFMLPDSTVNRRIKDLIKATNARGIPVSGPSLAQIEAGALMSYGIVHHEVGVQAAEIAQRLLRGADPATMPVQTADFYYVINAAATERIGIAVNEDALRRADLIVREDRLTN